MDWNILLDENGGPYHWRETGGCAAPVIYDTRTKTVHYTPVFHAVGHYTRFLKRGDRVIGSSSFSEDVCGVAARAPDGSIKLVLAIRTPGSQELHIGFGDRRQRYRFRRAVWRRWSSGRYEQGARRLKGERLYGIERIPSE